MIPSVNLGVRELVQKLLINLLLAIQYNTDDRAFLTDRMS